MAPSHRRPLPWHTQFVSSWDGLRALWRSLGPRQSARVLARVGAQRARGAPYRGWPKPATPKEAASRRQIGDAILLYRALRRHHDADRALALLEPVIVAGALTFLGERVGRIARDDFDGMNVAQRRELLDELAAGFFNARSHIGVLDDDRFELVVAECHFVAICERAGCPELAPLFCAGDLAFFADPSQDAALERPECLARGDARCLFCFRWKRG